MYTAGQWYTSGTFYGAASLIAIVLIGLLTVWVTYSVGVIKKRLTYTLVQTIPLVTATSTIPKEDLQVLYRGASLAEPRIVALRLSNQGSRDIRSDDFDQGKPLEIEVGAHIVTQLSMKPKPPDTHISGLRFENTKVIVEPSLIRRRQSITLELLVDGHTSKLSVDSPLVDVDIKEQDSEDRGFLSSLPWLGTLAVLALVANVPFFLNLQNAPQWLVAIAGVTAAAFILTLIEFLQRWSRRRNRH
jgi:hypothetical protein